MKKAKHRSLWISVAGLVLAINATLPACGWNDEGTCVPEEKDVTALREFLDSYSIEATVYCYYNTGFDVIVSTSNLLRIKREMRDAGWAIVDRTEFGTRYRLKGSQLIIKFDQRRNLIVGDVLP